MTDLQDQRVLLAATAGHRFALPLEIVSEILHPLPVHPLGNLPPYVSGVSIIRGEPTPVLDLARLFGEEQAAVGRFVALRLEQRRVALAVESVRRALRTRGHRLPAIALSGYGLESDIEQSRAAGMSGDMYNPPRRIQDAEESLIYPLCREKRTFKFLQQISIKHSNMSAWQTQSAKRSSHSCEPDCAVLHVVGRCRGRSKPRKFRVVRARRAIRCFQGRCLFCLCLSSARA